MVDTLYLVACIDNEKEMILYVAGIFENFENAVAEAENLFPNEKYFVTKGDDVQLLNYPNTIHQYNFGEYSAIILNYSRYHDTARFYTI